MTRATTAVMSPPGRPEGEFRSAQHDGTPVNVAQLLATAQAAGIERLDVQCLLATRLGRPRSWLLAHAEAPLAATQAAGLRADLARLAAGEPLAYVLGETEFHGLTLGVTPDVLIPRADTETLVDWALELLRGALSPVAAPRVLDLGTGSGAIAIAVKHAHAAAALSALDASPAALAVARANAERHGLSIRFVHGDWWAAVANERFDLALANPPYIAVGDAHLPALRHEPARALTSGATGLDDVQRIVEGAAAHLLAGAWLLLEHGQDQHEAVQTLLRREGFECVQTRRDLAGRPRCTGGRRRAGG